MTLAQLVETLLPQIPTSMQKDVKTAMRALAHALDYAEAKDCPLTVCQQPLPELYRRLEIHLTAQGKGVHTIRNTKNLVSRVFRLADAQGSLALTPATLTRRFSTHTLPGHNPHRSLHRSYRLNDGSALTRPHWPDALESAFQAFTKWATDPMSPERPAQWKKRLTTIKNYQSCFQAYFGFLHHQLQTHPLSFDQLFDFELIQQFVSWHINDKHRKPTVTIKMFLTDVKALVRQYRPNQTLLEQLKTLDKQIPKPIPTYQKNDAWVPLHELERVSTALWPTKNPEHLRHNGYVTATRAGISVMLQLWIYIPYRQANMRQMTLGDNLYQTPAGQWRIRFHGEQLKIAMKRGQPNAIDFPVPPAVLPRLTAYLQAWRPILAKIHHRPEVFLNVFGNPYGLNALYSRIKRDVYEHTGRYFHPHMIRTIWATEWIQSNGDFMTAAIMLNDRLETVIANYSHLRDENVAEKAYQWVQSRMNGR